MAGRRAAAPYIAIGDGGYERFAKPAGRGRAFKRPIRARACKNFDVKILKAVRSIKDARSAGGASARRGRAGGPFAGHPDVLARARAYRAQGLKWSEASRRAWAEATFVRKPKRESKGKARIPFDQGPSPIELG